MRRPRCRRRRARRLPRPLPAGSDRAWPTRPGATPARDDRLHAGRRPPRVVARLERHVERGAARPLARLRRAPRPRRGPRPPARGSPRPRTAPSRTTTAPTMGLGDVRPAPRAASSRARAIHSRSVMSSSGCGCTRQAFTAASARPRLLSEERVHEGLRVEGLEILDLLADPDQLDRHARAPGRCGSTMPPLAVPSSLVSTRPVSPTASWNIRACCEPVLAGGRLEHHQRLVGRAGQLAVDHALELDQLVHEVGLGVQAPGGVHEQHVDVARAWPPSPRRRPPRPGRRPRPGG